MGETLPMEENSLMAKQNGEFTNYKARSGFLTLNGVPTRVKTWGRWVEDPPTSPNEDIIVVIPGNPGIVEFYDLFLSTLYKEVKMPIWILGHAGHDVPEDGDIPPFKESPELYGLEGQIKHKAEFIEKYVPENARIFFIGHSFGSYIILELLKIPSIQKRVVDNYLLFPTIEEMAATRNGKFVNRCIKNIVWLICWAARLFRALPSAVSLFLLSCWMWLQNLPKIHVGPITTLIEAGVLERVFFMGIQEMNKVKKRDNAIINQNLDKITLFYGKTDHWAPPCYYESVKKEIPNIKAYMSNYHHEFVFNESEEIASLVSEWIHDRRLKL